MTEQMKEQMWSLNYTARNKKQYAIHVLATQEEIEQHALNLNANYELLVGVVSLPSDLTIVNEEPAKVGW